MLCAASQRGSQAVVRLFLQRWRLAPVAAMQMRALGVQYARFCSQQPSSCSLLASVLQAASSRGLLGEVTLQTTRNCQERCLKLPLGLLLNAVESCSSYYSPAGEQPTQPTRVGTIPIRSFVASERVGVRNRRKEAH